MGDDDLDWLWPILIVIAIVAAYIYAVSLFFTFLFGPIAAIAGIAASAVALYNFVRALHEAVTGKLPAGLNDGPSGPEPAYRQYFFHRAWLDLKDFLRRSYSLNRDAAQVAYYRTRQFIVGDGEGSQIMGRSRLWFTWPLIPAAALGGVAGVAAGTAFTAAAILLGSVIFAVVVAANGILTAATWATETVLNRVRGFKNHCPHCYARFDLPEYDCSTCSARHKKLTPGTYGIWRRKCRCKTLLPTTYIGGRHKLVGYCSKCKEKLAGEDPTRRPLLVPVVGPRASGKSVFQVGLVAGLEKRQEAGQCSVSFLTDDDRDTYSEAIRTLKTGNLLPQTLARLPKALQLNYDFNGRKFRAHMFDAAGESYEDEVSLGQLDYLEHGKGIILLIDPFSIPAVATRYHNDLKNAPRLGVAAESDPLELYARLMDFLQERGLRQGAAKIRLPIAVVITKCDALGLPTELGPEALREAAAAEGVPTKREKSRRPIDSSSLARNWLISQGLGTLVQNIESQFQTSRFFPIAILENRGSQKVHIDAALEPFDWIVAGGAKEAARPLVALKPKG